MMTGDYTRFTHKPRKGYSGLLMQQGRVQLDSDWNEQADIFARRWRAQAIDTFGPAAVSTLSTPLAFELTYVAGPPQDFSIGRGRLYVDGLVAEVFEDGTTSYLNQRFLPDPPALPSSGEAVAYLDVWEREVTYVQDPDLLEKALNGPDTATRRQTVWQVKLHGTASASCSADLDALFPPSAGRLSVTAIAPPASGSPCILSPSGGYRGLENRLYRVEVHTAGGFGTARFKWSRENASVVSAVSGITMSGSQSVLDVSRIGRDKVLRFKVGDWVEVTDDHRELMNEAGEMAQVTATSESALTITLDHAIPAPGGRAFGATQTDIEARHTRVVRWDQNSTQNTLDSDGLMSVGASQIHLEDGVNATFALQPATGEVKVGDYWVFHARTADASVDELVAEPPCGIVHHYTALATITGFGVTPAVDEDCRTLWPPFGGGCCTVMVLPGESIQAAVDSLPAQGGCVCLKTGVHTISAPIRIGKSNVVLRGESPGTVVQAPGTSAAADLPITSLDIRAANAWVNDVIVRDIRFEVTSAPQADYGFVAHLGRCRRVRIHDCTLEVTADGLPPFIGIYMDDSDDVVLHGNRLDNLLYGVYAHEPGQSLEIVNNKLSGLIYRFETAPNVPSDLSFGQYAVWVDVDDNVTPCLIENNDIEDFWVGVFLDAGAEGSLIRANGISRRAGVLAEPAPTTTAELRTYMEGRRYAIEVRAAGCSIQDNAINLPLSAWGGIAAFGPRAAIEGNRLDGVALGNSPGLPPSIYCGPNPNAALPGARRSQIRGNVLMGPQTGIVVSRVNGVEVGQNTVEGELRGWYGVRLDDAVSVIVSANSVRHVLAGLHVADGERNRLVDNDIREVGAGILLNNENDAELRGNTVFTGALTGIFGTVGGNTMVTNNRVSNSGFLSTPSIGIGLMPPNIWLVPAGMRVSIDACEVLDIGVMPGGVVVASGEAIGIGAILAVCEVTNNRVAYTNASVIPGAREHRALWLRGPLSISYAFGSGRVSTAFGSAIVSNNFFLGPGQSHLVEFNRFTLFESGGLSIDYRFAKATFSNNVCEHVHAVERGVTVKLWAGRLIAMGNQVSADLEIDSMDLSNRRAATLIGNVTTGGYDGAASVTPSPITSYNVQV